MLPNHDPSLVAIYHREDDNGFLTRVEVPIRGWNEYGEPLVAGRNGKLHPVDQFPRGDWRFVRVAGWFSQTSRYYQASDLTCTVESTTSSDGETRYAYNLEDHEEDGVMRKLHTDRRWDNLTRGATR